MYAPASRLALLAAHVAVEQPTASIAEVDVRSTHIAVHAVTNVQRMSLGQPYWAQTHDHGWFVIASRGVAEHHVQHTYDRMRLADVVQGA